MTDHYDPNGSQSEHQAQSQPQPQPQPSVMEQSPVQESSPTFKVTYLGPNSPFIRSYEVQQDTSIKTFLTSVLNESENTLGYITIRSEGAVQSTAVPATYILKPGDAIRYTVTQTKGGTTPILI